MKSEQLFLCICIDNASQKNNIELISDETAVC